MTGWLAGAFLLAEEAAEVAPGGGATQRAAPSLGQTLYGIAPMIAVVVLLMWFMSRSQKKRRQERQQMLEGLRPKDDVVTIGGIHGRIVSIKEDQVVLRVDPDKDIKLTFAKSGISHRIGEEDQAAS